MPGPHTLVPFLLLGVLLGGCSPSESSGPQPVRTVKLAEVGSLVPRAPLLPGMVRQPRTANLAFENPGRVLQVLVEVGTRVAAGQVLAEQDAEPARLRLAQAQARLQAAKVELDQRRTSQRRAKRLFADGNLSAAEVEAANAAQGSAQAQQREAEAELALARRTLAQTRLRAPFAGRIVSRIAAPLRLVGAGEPLFELQAEGERQVVVNIPVALAGQLQPNATAQAFATSGGTPLALRLVGVSPQAEQGLLQEAIFTLDPSANALPSGSLLDVRLPLPLADTLAVPLGALLPGQDGKAGNVYVYQAATQQVQARAVTFGALQDGQVLIDSGLAAGERIVVAGAAFLRSGERVQPYQPSTLLTRE
ncbi:efflux RND transporter periplasmic adaptor subunit [Pseudomonas oryzihabitans]|uniref:RND family efflux transporter MFP subunit n=1 Tax=Pseudomonas oryzihabitans TaxID=47885 RepID=A0AAJ2BNU6_9PSED|nr:efflux RND transporter periplasmic adaptor subunit [Pseudomonas psychrotolerans]MDR6236540.1 RND family efflux transporter MFP subunit [Pseudomonas psychrotolerans]MDR6354067.1 RND family efflux transporter MFP subunit [Pseudomonas psychrotolerans]